ncbi:type II toxin-antitoxin system VapC family toxin [Calidifontibacter sp. DB0510]|uniref:Ribonuclease VapC n=1 Tax=Metallococcus carri TaxID=1656884 RepID=A0A967B821_9MICO|nr:type II toxin-antitoxin system VapC family toxin [Metallococcus carri]NHN57297.1 type II toxin-antitoxin system VapC family toxin [Metallococcus carri]NOP38098.1 type II toxin-antitoxin system VapC family toxin [Calidifontibacter sp. DB2511S]
MTIHLDTTFLVDAIREGRRGQDGPARRWLAEHRGETLGLSVFVLAELLVGAELHANPDKERRRVLQVLGELPVIEPDSRLAETYARVHASLAQQGAPLATMDVLIGSTALNHDAALLTANRAHFSRIVGLRVLGY